MCYKLRTCLAIKDNCLFKNWPVVFRWDEAGCKSATTTTTTVCDVGTSTGLCNNSSSSITNHLGLQRPPSVTKSPKAKPPKGVTLRVMRQHSSRLARYAIAHSFGRWMLYPGSICLLNKIPLSLLVKGRTRLMEDFHGKRAKLIACDGNEIDTMFVDRRKTKKMRGHRGMQLVICCEGNGSFYEVGCLFTPLKAGYSVLGWNHPGFARSTGKPYPQNDINAMDVVIQYATHRLNFSLQDVVIYGYSLGSYTATWAAMTYPELGALILDASFDGLLPLATKVITKSWRKLVVKTVLEHFNLNVVEQLCKYPGPVLLIRRTLDEITSTQFSLEDHLPVVKTNRANELLLQLLRCRYPDLMAEEEDTVLQWLAADNRSVEALIYHCIYKVDEGWCQHALESYKAGLGPNGQFPWRIGENLPSGRKKQLALFLAQKHMRNVETTHGRTLPTEEFQMPWKL